MLAVKTFSWEFCLLCGLPLPEYLQDLVLGLALLGEGDIEGSLAGGVLQVGGHGAAHGLDLLVQQSVLPLQLLRVALQLGHLFLEVTNETHSDTFTKNELNGTLGSP